MAGRSIATPVLFLAVVLQCGMVRAEPPVASETIPVQWNLWSIVGWFPGGTVLTQDVARTMKLPLHSSERAYVGEKGHENTMDLHTCADVLKYVPRIRPPESIYPEWVIIERRATQCVTLARLAQLTPARAAYLPLATKPLLGQIGRLVLPSTDPWMAHFFSHMKVRKDPLCTNSSEDDICLVVSGRYGTSVRAVALGDYNGDGIADLVIQGELSWSSGNPEKYADEVNVNQVGVVVTRNSPDGELTVVDWWGWRG